MKETLADEIVREGIEVLYKQLGTLKTLKFLQLLGATRGDSVKEIEGKTEKMSSVEVLNLVSRVRHNRTALWKRIGLV